ncbi:hypothetical protein KIN20_012063 [Parelaphostrongylus tenuis]|uniref:long-chain-fatty-acid--CoA ligase n=1 Tax=Parelaphostrongylus tenuis TaxID=148309 RepID=A0AAD5MAC5_PARTN|nr:hypothetical protein KIN20_012063 [Parelaphostrongylus tenuis]
MATTVLRPYPSVCYKSVVLAIGCTPSRKAKRLRRRYLADENERSPSACLEKSMETPTATNSIAWTMLSVAIALIGTVLFYSIRKRTNGICLTPSNVSRKAQSLPVKGEPGVYKCGLLSDDQNYIDSIYPEVKTLWDAFNRGIKESDDGPCLGTRGADGQYYFMKYTDVLKQSSHLASALVGVFNLKPGERIGIYAKNRAEWLISALACVLQSIIIVPLYDTLGVDVIPFIISQAEISVIIAESSEKLQNLTSLRSLLPTLKTVVLMDWHDNANATAEMNAAGIELLSLQEAYRRGSQNPQPKHLPKRDDTYIISYTSGSTGTPKGVIITHYNILSNISGWLWTMNHFIPNIINNKTCVISYLPLAHVMEQVTHWMTLMHGAQIGYYSGNIQVSLKSVVIVVLVFFPHPDVNYIN